jgi:hypothetical protein
MQTQITRSERASRLGRFWKNYCRLVNQTMYFK